MGKNNGIITLKYRVADLKLLAKMVRSSKLADETRLSDTLHDKQPHFCKVIDEVRTDPRCENAHRFCMLYCAGALEYAIQTTGESPPVYPESNIHDMACNVAQNRDELIGKRGSTFSGRIRRYVLSGKEFDDDDTNWLCTMISTFLFSIEKSLSRVNHRGGT